MIPLVFLRENPDFVIERLGIKNFQASEYVNVIINYDKSRRSLQKQLDDNFAEQNKIAKEIGILFKEGKKEEAQLLKDRTAVLKVEAKTIEENLSSNENAINEILVLLPNLPHSSVPKGYSAEDNEIVYSEGDLTLSS